MTAFTHDELLSIAAAHATGVATSEEELALYAAMQNDSVLRDEVSLNRRALEAMARVQAVQPSDLLRRRLMTQVRELAPPPLAAATDQTPRRAAWRTILLGAAAAVIVAGMGSEILRLRGQVDGVTAFSAALQAQLDERESALNRMLTAENHLRIVNMVASDTAQSPGVQVYWNRADGMAVVHAFRLPLAPKGQRYQLWAVGDGSRPRSLLAFDSNKGGHVLIPDMPIPVDLKSIHAFELTVEPESGSVAPTSAALMQVTVTGS